MPLPRAAAVQAQTVSTSPSAQIERGIQLMRDGQFAAAKLEFSSAIKANQGSADALIWRGICENQLKQYQMASQDFIAALRIDPTAQPAHYNLALSLIRLGRDEAAIHELEIVVKANPGAVQAQYNLAVLLEGRRSTAEAAQHLDVAYQAQPNDLGIAQHLLIDDLVLGRSAEAESILETLRSENTPPGAQLEIGTALLEAGHFSEAASLIESGRSRLPASKEADQLLARAYIGAREDSKAIDLLKPLTVDPKGGTAYLLGLAYSGAGATQEAIEAFEEAAKSDSRDARPFFHLGMIYSTMPEQQAQALHDLHEAVRLDPRNATYSIGLARTLLQGDHPKEALEVLQHVHSQGGEGAEQELLLGIAQVATSGVTSAISTLERAIAMDPSLALAHNVLGFCYFKQGDYLRAAHAYQRASDLSPGTLVFAYDAAMAFERANRDDEATVYASRAAALPNARSDDHYLLGKVYAKTGRKEDAIRELQLAVEMNPDQDNSYYLLARTYLQMGDTAQAAAWNSKLTALKQQHDQSYAEKKNAQREAMTPSNLLRGVPVSSDDVEENGTPIR